MTQEDTYKLAATLAIHQHLIKQLIILNFGRVPNPLGQLEGFKQRTLAGMESATLPVSDPSLSDAMAQEMADIARRILEESQEALASLLSQQPPTAREQG